jgi:hypothetical protein
MDLLRRELAIWALRNFSACDSVCAEIVKSADFPRICFEQLKTGVANIMDSTLALMSNAAKNNCEVAGLLLPLAPLPCFKKNETLTLV